jgi:hypothetical protein
MAKWSPTSPSLFVLAAARNLKKRDVEGRELYGS